MLFHIDGIGQGICQFQGLFPRTADTLFGWREDEFGPQRPQQLLVLIAHQFRHANDDAVAFEPADVGQGNARIATAGLDNGPAWDDAARALGVLKHIQCGPVLQAVGVEHL